MSEYHVLVWVGPTRSLTGVRVIARNKMQAMMIAGQHLGNLVNLHDVAEVEVKLMRRV